MTSLAVLMAVGLSAKAQEVTVNLIPGWTWISYPNTEVMDIETVLGDFVPMQGDIIKSQFSQTVYINGRWIGRLRQFTPGIGYKYYSNRTEDVEFVFAQASNSVVTTATPTDITATSAMVGGTVTLEEGGHVFLRGVCWGTEPNPDIDGSHTSNGSEVGSFNSRLEGLTRGTTYYVRAYAVTDYGLDYGEEFSFIPDYGYVDLGLPSGTLWATCNVGADAPEDYGDYFAWGETLPKDSYDWDTYRYCNGSYNTLTKYCYDSLYGYNGFTDNLVSLLPEDDAAMVNWDEDWRMPIKEEWQELYNNTTCTWTIQNGVIGMLFAASNGNSLFLPAAGYRVNDNLNNAGVFGDYWSSSLDTEEPCYAWRFYVDSISYDMYNGDRYVGFTVRPVRASVPNNAPTGAIDGKFTIDGNGDQVYFSQGNLQYIGSASTPYWKFAENQWDLLGTTTGQNSSNQNVDRDLFGWGTSGWNTGNSYYRPWDTNTSTGASYGPPGMKDLTDTYANADWGVYNPISNGGNESNLWRTLSTDEWKYVFNSRSTATGIRYAKANVNEVNGVILLPDDWNTSYYGLNNTNTKAASFTSNIITASEWNYLERLGAIFLPATGYRYGTKVKELGSRGHYWSSTHVNANYAYGVYFYATDAASDMNPEDCCNRTYGRGVRLVRVAE